MTGTIKVLFLAADPFDRQDPLRLDREARAIADAVRDGPDGVTLQVAHVLAARAGDLQKALQDHAPQVVHFAGHGEQSRGIFLEDAAGRPAAVSKEALRELFGILGRSVRVVVLNACESLPTIQVIHDLVDYTVGMNSPISDRAAILFADGFYTALARGNEVETAFALGVSRINLEGVPGSEVPVLLKRPGVTSGPIAVPPAAPTEEPARSADGRGRSIRLDRVKMRDFVVTQGDGSRTIHHVDRRPKS